jgi:CheY-like chemotaxis protein
VTVLLFLATRELLFNIVKHARVKEARADVACLNGQIQITVTDEGTGFDPTQLRVAGGSAGGFGLFSIRERLQLLGGRMEIDSAPTRGSRITLFAPVKSLGEIGAVLPAAREPALSVGLASAQEAAPARAEARTRVLLVDDHIVVRQGLARLLQEASDMEVVGEASDGESAVRLVRELLPDVVLMDISMPGMNGIQATEIIHAELPKVLVIGLSMFEENERAAAMKRAGAVAYVTKSGPADAVITAIREAALLAREKGSS